MSNSFTLGKDGNGDLVVVGIGATGGLLVETAAASAAQQAMLDRLDAIVSELQAVKVAVQALQE